MKKALTITGRVELSREEITKAIAKYLKEEEQLATEKVVYEIKILRKETTLVNGAYDLEGAVVYVHQVHTQDIVPLFGKEKRTSNQPDGTRRPNYGIGNLLRDVFNDGKAFTLNELMEEVKDEFPTLTFTQLNMYATREAMVGFQVTKFKSKGGQLFQKTESYLESQRDSHALSN